MHTKFTFVLRMVAVMWEPQHAFAPPFAPLAARGSVAEIDDVKQANMSP